MEYAFRECRINFTLGQSDRMHFYIDNFWNMLTSSFACFLSCESPAYANFTLDSECIGIGALLNVKNLSNQYTSQEWIINDLVISTDQNFNFQFDTEGDWYKTEEIIWTSYTNIVGCDSTILKDLEVQPLFHSTNSIDNCEGDSIYLYGQYYSNEGLLDFHFTSVNGCDSIESYVLNQLEIIEFNEWSIQIQTSAFVV